MCIPYIPYAQIVSTHNPCNPGISRFELVSRAVPPASAAHTTTFAQHLCFATLPLFRRTRLELTTISGQNVFRRPQQDRPQLSLQG